MTFESTMAEARQRLATGREVRREAHARGVDLARTPEQCTSFETAATRSARTAGFLRKAASRTRPTSRASAARPPRSASDASRREAGRRTAGRLSLGSWVHARGRRPRAPEPNRRSPERPAALSRTGASSPAPTAVARPGSRSRASLPRPAGACSGRGAVRAQLLASTFPDASAHRASPTRRSS